ncbi:MAG: BtrH N-terminal domain-containing protein [Deltaproteobacteria bacterium]|nr:BtrH N-terminal domain-containing protein [Deltaproteobacteria bacterium]
MTTPFIHRHAAHCETGTVAALLRDRGLDLSEPMVFGIGGGVFFIYVPFVKMGGIPLAAYRGAPGSIIKSAYKRLGVKVRVMRFRSPDDGMASLDRFLAAGTSVGLRTSGYWLPYFPQNLRFQFNAHHLVAFGKEGGDYILSDPVFEHPVRCPAADLRRARFTKGLFAPKGLLFYPEEIPANPDIKGAVIDGIRFTCRRMLVPVPFMGVAGIRYLSRQMRKWPDKLGMERAAYYMGSVVRMQEEIGTGGAGFRFMYTAFLQEAAGVTGMAAVSEAAGMMSETGDKWREFAVMGAKVCKGVLEGPGAYAEIADRVFDCAEREERIFRLLKGAV